jgi:hypothetical protein
MDRLNIAGALISEHSWAQEERGRDRYGNMIRTVSNRKREGWREVSGRLQGTNLSCWVQLVPEVPRMFHGDGEQWARFIVARWKIPRLYTDGERVTVRD